MHRLLNLKKAGQNSDDSATITPSTAPTTASTASSITPTLQHAEPDQTLTQVTREDMAEITATVLGIVEIITGAFQTVPYVSMVASLLGQGLKMKNVCDFLSHLND